MVELFVIWMNVEATEWRNYTPRCGWRHQNWLRYRLFMQVKPSSSLVLHVPETSLRSLHMKSAPIPQLRNSRSNPSTSSCSVSTTNRQWRASELKRNHVACSRLARALDMDPRKLLPVVRSRKETGREGRWHHSRCRGHDHRHGLHRDGNLQGPNELSDHPARWDQI